MSVSEGVFFGETDSTARPGKNKKIVKSERKMPMVFIQRHIGGLPLHCITSSFHPSPSADGAVIVTAPFLLGGFVIVF